jgi:hypothetical protein
MRRLPVTSVRKKSLCTPRRQIRCGWRALRWGDQLGKGRLYLNEKRVQMRHRPRRKETLLPIIGLVIAAAAVVPDRRPYFGITAPARTP